MTACLDIHNYVVLEKKMVYCTSAYMYGVANWLNCIKNRARLKIQWHCMPLGMLENQALQWAGNAVSKLLNKANS